MNEPLCFYSVPRKPSGTASFHWNLRPTGYISDMGVNLGMSNQGKSVLMSMCQSVSHSSSNATAMMSRDSFWRTDKN